MTVFLERVILAILTGLALFLVLGPNPMHFSWPQRIWSLLVILALAGLVSWGINRLNKKKVPPSSEIKAIDGRIFVPISPKDLTRIYDGRTKIQADKAAAIYIGKWMQVSGPVSDIENGLGGVTVRLDTNPPFFLIFPKKDWFDRLQILPRGHFVTANGQILHITQHWLQLDNCELVETAGK